MVRSTSSRIEAISEGKCAWRLYVATYIVSICTGELKCYRNFRNRQATSTCLAKKFLNNLEMECEYSITNMIANR